MTTEAVDEHICRLNAIIERYDIRHARQILNLDQCCVFFRATGRRAKRKMLMKKNTAKLCKTIVKTKNIDHVAIISVLSASGFEYKPVVVYPGVQAHYRKVRGTTDTLHDHLILCKLSLKKSAGVDSKII